MPVPASHPIDWGVIGRAVEFYKDRGYEYIEVAWAVDRPITAITLPEGAKPFTCGDFDLVGSGEQSFLQLMAADLLPPGRYVTCTPCFRDEPLDEWHCKHFMKVELLDTSRVSRPRVNRLMNEATAFLQQEGASFFDLERVRVEDPLGPQVDLMWKGIEFGSYGLRTYNDLSWVYGTGVAEPRFSQIRAL